MTKTVDPKTTWWWWWDVQQRLTKWTHALLKGRKYTIHLSVEGTGYLDPVNHVIQANPQLFKERNPDTQFTVTQGILAHEVGHAFFTGGWPDQRQNRLCELVNMLEDERIDRCICTYYPGVEPAIRLLGNLMLAGVRALGLSEPGEQQAYTCILYWRWAHRRVDEERFLSKLQVNPAGQKLWRRIRPMVEQAWVAENTSEVVDIAREILDILAIPANTRPKGLPGMSTSDIPQTRSGDTGEDGEGSAMGKPDGPADGDQPGLGQRAPGKGSGKAGEEELEVECDTYSKPAPYVELEKLARPLANQLSDALKLPQPEVRNEPHEWLGRYSFRQEMRTPETPNLARQGIERSPRSLAIQILADRSGSMEPLNEEVRLALMITYLAATDLAIPTGLIYFGAHCRDYGTDKVMEVSPLAPVASEAAKALIAGYEGNTGAEFLNWGLDMAEKALANSPERKKAVIVIHDGNPVYNGREGNDWLMSRERIKKLEKAGIVVIGVFLGQDPNDEKQLKMLFSRWICCSGVKLPEKLGHLLRSLA